ncbi:MAG TPA: universal stress protein [Smithellaceae bacterium]|jgi:nucleotide-binding universal stress UspA family protein|nr:universal stress protein [Smithellaceae bacterium]HQG81592.1 universal stress protein [Smithellaceae bacterium]
MFAPKRILVPTDFSVYSDNALREAVDIAKQNKAKIFLLHVVDDGIRQCAVDYCLDEEAFQAILKESQKNALDKLQQEAEKIAGSDNVEIEFETIRGIPYEVILKEEESKNIDLIVIASHGKTGILKNLLGSVVDKVSKRAKCQVLLVRS